MPEKSLVPWRVQLAPRGRAGCAAQPTVHSAPHTTKNSARCQQCAAATALQGPEFKPRFVVGLFLLLRVLLHSLRVSGCSVCSLCVLRQALALRGEAARPRLDRGRGGEAKNLSGVRATGASAHALQAPKGRLS